MTDLIIFCLQNSILFEEVLQVYTPISLDSISTLSNEIMKRPTPRYFSMTASAVECAQSINSAENGRGKYNNRHRAISLIHGMLFIGSSKIMWLPQFSLKYGWTVHTIPTKPMR